MQDREAWSKILRFQRFFSKIDWNECRQQADQHHDSTGDKEIPRGIGVAVEYAAEVIMNGLRHDDHHNRDVDQADQHSD